MKKFTSVGPVIKVPDFKTFKIVFQITYLANATMKRKQFLPSKERKSVGAFFKY